jgi:hypothetical protein
VEAESGKSFDYKCGHLFALMKEFIFSSEINKVFMVFWDRENYERLHPMPQRPPTSRTVRCRHSSLFNGIIN